MFSSRRIIFFLVDFIKRKPVINHLNKLQFFFNLNAEERKIKQDFLIQSIVEYSAKHTSFYSNYKLTTEISSLPVVNKTIIRSKEQEFISNEFRESELIKAVTSGSTGTPFKTYQDREKKNRNTADTIFFASLGGFNIGDKLFYFKIWSKNNIKNRWTLFMQNIIPVDVIELQKNQNEIIKSLLKNEKSINVLGYVSAVETLIKAIDNSKTSIPKNLFQSVITMSESINDFVKETGKRIFGCPVLSRYSNIENGIIAQQTLMDENVFLINSASYFVEIFDSNSDCLLSNGELGRIVVTDLYNKAMPMIRYDTGDLGVKSVKKINGIDSDVLLYIEGRKLDQIYNTKGELLSSYIVYKNMWQYTEINQYQFIQWSALDYEFKINISGKFVHEEKLIVEFKEFLGYDSIFNVSYVDEIPLLDSGKRKKIVSHYKKVSDV